MKPFNYVVITFYFSAITISVLQQKISFHLMSVDTIITIWQSVAKLHYSLTFISSQREGKDIDPKKSPHMFKWFKYLSSDWKYVMRLNYQGANATSGCRGHVLEHYIILKQRHMREVKWFWPLQAAEQQGNGEMTGRWSRKWRWRTGWGSKKAQSLGKHS